MAQNPIKTELVQFLDAVGNVSKSLYLSGGALSIDGTAIDAGTSNIPLTSAHLFVGNGSNIATDVALSGEASLANTGAITLGNAAVIAKVLTGYAAGAGTVSATDSILSAIQKVDGNSSNATVISRVLTGYASGAGTVAATDTILQAFQKLNGNDGLNVKIAQADNFRLMATNGSANIAEAAAITASRALISDANGIPTQSATTSTELGFVSGVTSAIQTQINTKAVFPVLTTATISSNLTSLSSTTFADLTGWTITITTTRANEVVSLYINLYAQLTTAAGTGYFAYVVDAGSAVPFGFFTVANNNEGGPVGSAPIGLTIASAGSHTIKLQYKVDSGKVMSVFGTTGATNLAQLQTVQF